MVQYYTKKNGIAAESEMKYSLHDNKRTAASARQQAHDNKRRGANCHFTSV